MSERDTATVTLSKGEVRKIIAALADDEVTESGQHRERLLNLQDRLEGEFDFDEHQAKGGESEVPDGRDAVVGDEGLVDESDEGILNLGDEKAIELSRAEAEDILDALADYDGSQEDEQVIENVRERIASEFE